MKKIYVQHGDVLLEKVLEIPSESRAIKVFEGFVIEKGEGIHTHRLVAIKEGLSPSKLNSMMDKVEVYEVGEDMYIKVKENVALDHEEHGIQILEPGIYKKNIEREYDYEANEERKVID